MVADASTDTLTLAGGSNVTITTDAASDTITIASADTNTEYTAGNGLDLTGTAFSLDLKTGSGLVIDSTELSIDDSIIATLSGSVFSGHVGVTGSLHTTAEISGSILRAPVLTGSLTKLEDGSSYIIAGTNVQVVSGTSGAVTISSTDTNTEYTAGDGLDLTSTTFSLDLKSRYYHHQYQTLKYQKVTFELDQPLQPMHQLFLDQ